MLYTPRMSNPFKTLLIAASLLPAACTTAPDADTDPLLASEATAALGKADGRILDVTPGMRWLSKRPEAQLARLFQRGTASRIPQGKNRQQPLVDAQGGSGLLPLVQELFEGTIWTADEAGGTTVLSAFVPRIGGAIAPYRGRASRSRMSELAPASGQAPPSGTSWPHLLSPYSGPIQIDDRPSVFVDYQADPTPILGRSVDEFREIDEARCPGLYLVRTHYLPSLARSEWVYLFYIAADFGPAARVCDLDRLL